MAIAAMGNPSEIPNLQPEPNPLQADPSHPDPYQQQLQSQWPNQKGTFNQAPDWVSRVGTRILADTQAKGSPLGSNEVKQILQQEGGIQPLPPPNTTRLAAASHRQSRSPKGSPAILALQRQLGSQSQFSQ